jgi:hypothetical protein
VSLVSLALGVRVYGSLDRIHDAVLIAPSGQPMAHRSAGA